MQAEETWEDDVSELSSVVDPSSIGVRRYNNPHYNVRDSESSPREPQLPDDDDDHYLSDGTSSPLTTGKKFVQSNSGQSQDETAEDPDDYCKEVQCIDMEDSSRHMDSDGGNEGALALSGTTDVNGQENLVNRDRELGQMQHGFAYDALEQRRNDVRMTIDSLATAGDMPSSRSFSLTRSWSCRADLRTGSFSPDKADRTPPNGFEKGFPGRPDGHGRKFPLLNFDSKSIRLSRNNSESSFGSVSMDAQGGRTGDDDVTSLHTFVTGLKEIAKLEYEKKLVDGQVRREYFIIHILA